MTLAVDRRRIIRKRGRLRQLRAFCAMARLGSVARAAQHLGLSPPSVAHQVRELEHELEAVLFERGGGGVALTAAGERFHALAGPLVERMDALLEEFADRVENDVKGCVDVAASVAGAATVLPRYVKRLRARHPQVRVGVRSCTLGEGLALLSAGEVEFVLGAREPIESVTLEYREVLRYDIVLITPRDHPLAGRKTVTPKEAAEWPAIAPPAGSYSRQFGDTTARELGLEVGAVLDVGGWGVIKRYVERGVGICAVPSICLHETDQVSVIPLKTQLRQRSFGVYMGRGKALTAPARALLGTLIPGSATLRGGGARH